MNRDRRAVRDTRKKISLNEYDIEWIEARLNRLGGEEAKFLYEVLKLGMAAFDSDLQEQQGEAA